MNHTLHFLAIAVFGCLFGAAATATPPQRPNIVWIVSEDNGPYLGCFGDAVADTPHLDNLAHRGHAFDRAFANSPACAPARFTLITGQYPVTHPGSEGMRSYIDLPQETPFFPKYMREAGYFTANWGKTDYNAGRYEGGNTDLAIQEAWDISVRDFSAIGPDIETSGAHWRSRPQDDTPFFIVLNTFTTHESFTFPSVRPSDPPATGPSAVILPPYQPDTPMMREDWAYFYDRLHDMDAEAGRVLAQLKEDGLLEDTIVFYFSDHGGILGRSKRVLYDSGTRIPLIVYFGKNVRHLAPARTGERLDRLVSFVDFAPTTLSLAGVKPPASMPGRIFLGPHAEEAPDTVFLHRQRMSERIDLRRGLRDERFLYLRNYFPHRPLGQHMAFQERIPSTAQWRALFESGELRPAQERYFLPTGYEELYDTRADPHQVHNLAGNLAYRQILDQMRSHLDATMLRLPDAGLYWQLPQGDASPEEVLTAANLAAQGGAKNLDRLRSWMTSPSPVLRFWGAHGAVVRGKASAPLEEDLRRLFDDPYPPVAITAAEAMCRLGDPNAAIPVFERALDTEDGQPSPALWALNAMQASGPGHFRPLFPRLEELAAGKGYNAHAARYLLATAK